jgi:hypothetical protein
MARNRATANLTKQSGLIEPIKEAQHVERRSVWRSLWSTPCREQTWPGDGGRRGPTTHRQERRRLCSSPRARARARPSFADCRLGDAQLVARKSKESACIGITAEGCGCETQRCIQRGLRPRQPALDGQRFASGRSRGVVEGALAASSRLYQPIFVCSSTYLSKATNNYAYKPPQLSGQSRPAL